MLVWGAWRDALARATAALAGAEARLDALGAPVTAPAVDDRVVAAATTRLDGAARVLDGWSGAPWPSLRDVPVGTPSARLLRVGTIAATDGVHPPFAVPVGRGGHLALDGDVRDPRVAGLVQGVLLRLLAGSPAGDVRVAVHDPAGLGRAFAALRPLAAAGVLTDAGSSRSDLMAALDVAAAQVQRAWSVPDEPRSLLVLVVTALPPGAGADVEGRLAALAHAGPDADVALVLTSWPPLRPPGHPPAPRLENTTWLRTGGDAWIPSVPGLGDELDLPVVVDDAPPPDLVDRVVAALAEGAPARSRIDLSDLLPEQLWTESSAPGLAAPVGRTGAGTGLPVVLRFDDATPHWLVAGRSGAGKTVFLLDALASLTARYAPDDLALQLLDFKEGVSFTEFTPTALDPTWVPHARAVGVESDREYGLAVLRSLRAEMARRADAFKEAGVTDLAALRAARPRRPLPRIVTVIDEFQVLFAGNDAVARQAADHLEDVARRGRSYGVHLVLASQTTSGIEALQTRIESIFGQFPLRVALPGGSGVLDPLNESATGLPVGTAVVNTDAGRRGADTLVRLPWADPATLGDLRRRLWERRPDGASPPAVFTGFADAHVVDDPDFAGLVPGVPRPRALVGRYVDVGSPTAAVEFGPAPGAHLAVVGADDAAADVVHAALLSIARQHRPGSARFVVASLVPGGDPAATDAIAVLRADGHPVERVDAAGFVPAVAALATSLGVAGAGSTYLAVLGAEAAGPALAQVDPNTFRSAAEHLRDLVRQGPLHGVHLVAWWRVLGRLAADLGPSAREDVGHLLALDVPLTDLQTFLGRYDLQTSSRPGRGLLAGPAGAPPSLVVPFVRPRAQAVSAP